MSSYDLKAEKRSTTGKSAARLLRVAGKVPAVAYGRKETPVSLTVGAKDVWDMMAHHHSHGLLSLNFEDGTALPVIIKSVQRHPVSHKPQSIDFMRVSLTEEIEATIPIVLKGEPIGVKEGGVLVQAMHELHIRALPGNLPESIEVDVSELILNGAPIHVGQIQLPEGISAVTDAEESVAVVNAPDVEPIVEAPMDAADVEAIEQAEQAEDEQDKDKDGK